MVAWQFTARNASKKEPSLPGQLSFLQRVLTPGVQKVDPASSEICHVARSELRPQRLNNGSDLRIELADRLPLTLPEC